MTTFSKFNRFFSCHIIQTKYFFFHFRKPFYCTLVASVFIFALVNIVCAVFTKKYQQDIHQTVPFSLFYMRVIINDGLFISYGVLLSISIYKLTRTTSANLLLEARVGWCFSLAVCSFHARLFSFIIVLVLNLSI